MTGRSDEILEGVLLLTDLGETPEFIGSQLGIATAVVRDIIKTGRVPAVQKTLFPDSTETKQSRPETPWERVVQVCKQ